jgi:acetyl-CoA C-acetyltransferase
VKRCAVIGIGQTKHAAVRSDVSMRGLVREAVFRALEDARLTLDDVDTIFLGKAPDMFEGVMMPELFLADALGAVGKKLLRIHTAGSVGGSTCIAAVESVATGHAKVALAVAFEKQSESEALWALSPNVPFQPAIRAGAGSTFASFLRLYIEQYGVPKDIGIRTALKDRQNALNNPYAHVQIPGISYEQIGDSPMLWDPLRYLESCPSSDGACAVVIVPEERVPAQGAAWVHSWAVRSEPRMYPGRDVNNPAAGRACASDLYRGAGITDPLRQIDCAEVYVPFSWFESLWLENLGFAEPGEGWKLVDAGETALTGRIPWNMSGGVLSSNPIGASGMLRFAEAALQVRGMAEARQVEHARLALGHAYGGLNQYFAMWLVGSRRPA